MRLVSITLILCCWFNNCQSQYYEDDADSAKFHNTALIDVGIGYGIDYARLGIRAAYSPFERLKFTAAVGYNWVGMSWAAGTQFVFTPDSWAKFHAMANFGTVAEIYLPSTPEYNMAFLGPSLGAGVDMHPGDRNFYWRAGILFPFRPESYHRELESLQSNPAISAPPAPLPLSMGIGYHYLLH